jgi:glycosyltransferase involved in cell wall biosynthesis
MRVQFLNPPPQLGGPGTFQIAISECLVSYGHCIDIYPSMSRPDVIFVISGTRRLAWLIFNKLHGVKIVQRIDGYNWRSLAESESLYHYFKTRIQNIIIYIIRKYLADVIVYQSSYINSVWDKKFGIVKTDHTIIHNSAAKAFFLNQQNINSSTFKLVCVEGTIQIDPVVNKLFSALDQFVFNSSLIDSVDIYGKLETDIADQYPNINFKGVVSKSEILLIYSNINVIFFVLERNPPCPNSLIESICSGVPSLGLNEGSYQELADDSGYLFDVNMIINSDYKTVYDLVSNGIMYVIKNYTKMSANSVCRSKLFRREIMCNRYIKLIESLIS